MSLDFFPPPGNWRHLRDKKHIINSTSIAASNANHSTVAARCRCHHNIISANSMHSTLAPTHPHLPHYRASNIQLRHGIGGKRQRGCHIFA